MTSTECDAVAQSDELEALASIYGDALLPSEDRSVLNIRIDDETSLKVRFPRDYPSKSPPQYEINAPQMRGEPRLRLQSELEELYLANMGLPIVFLWVEATREFIAKSKEESKSEAKETKSDENEESGHKHEPKIMSDALCPSIVSGSIIEDRKSVFQAHFAAVKSLREVKLVMAKLKENKKIANATHNIQAYRIVARRGNTKTFLHDCDDDGESHAGSRLLHLLELMDAEDVLVVVSRWYGGIQLGPDRFKHINNAAREVLTQAGIGKTNNASNKSNK